MIATSWEVAGGEQLVAAWGQAPAMVQEKLEAFMHAATIYVESEIRERTPTSGHGTLRQSWTSEVTSLSDNVIGVVGTPLSYAIPVELGTKPHFPPVDAIEDWVQVKFGLSGPEARSVAFAVARKIAKKGTKGAFMVKNAFEASKPELERQAQLAIAAIAEQLAAGGAH